MNNKTSLSSARIIKKTGILVDTENSVIIAEGINLRVENKKKHLVGIIDVENALIEIKQGKTFVKIPLVINQYFITNSGGMDVAIIRVDDRKYCISYLI